MSVNITQVTRLDKVKKEEINTIEELFKLCEETKCDLIISLNGYFNPITDRYEPAIIIYDDCYEV